MTTRVKATAHTQRCSFCGKPSEDVKKLIAGPGVFICDGCVALCNEILQQQSGPEPGALSWTERLTDDEMLNHVGRVATASAQLDDNLQMWVDTLRGRGVTWARIGLALGMTRQSAWERFSGED